MIKYQPWMSAKDGGKSYQCSIPRMNAAPSEKNAELILGLGEKNERCNTP